MDVTDLPAGDAKWLCPACILKQVGPRVPAVALSHHQHVAETAGETASIAQIHGPADGSASNKLAQRVSAASGYQELLQGRYVFAF